MAEYVWWALDVIGLLDWIQFPQKVMGVKIKATVDLKLIDSPAKYK